MLPDFELERAITRELREWSKSALERSNEHYNNLPACPYAKKAWQEDRVGFCFKYDSQWQDLYKLVSQWDDSKDVVILVDFCPLPLDEMDEYLNGMNEAISAGFFINKDMFLMGFHPEDVDNELLEDEDFQSTVDVPYAMIFLQRLSKLQESSDALRLKGYYDKCEDYYGSTFLYANRNRLYRKLKNEKSS